VDEKKRSLGRDVFGKPDRAKSEAVKKILQDKVHRETSAREVEVKVKITPSNLRHLDTLIDELHKVGKGRFTRNELIRIAITLLSVGDF
jgi:hypothetical protein